MWTNKQISCSQIQHWVGNKIQPIPTVRSASLAAINYKSRRSPRSGRVLTLLPCTSTNNVTSIMARTKLYLVQDRVIRFWAKSASACRNHISNSETQNSDNFIEIFTTLVQGCRAAGAEIFCWSRSRNFYLAPVSTNAAILIFHISVQI